MRLVLGVERAIAAHADHLGPIQIIVNHLGNDLRIHNQYLCLIAGSLILDLIVLADHAACCWWSYFWETHLDVS